MPKLKGISLTQFFDIQLGNSTFKHRDGQGQIKSRTLDQIKPQKSFQSDKINKETKGEKSFVINNNKRKKLTKIKKRILMVKFLFDATKYVIFSFYSICAGTTKQL